MALAIVVALAVGALAQTRLGEDLLVDLALLAQRNLALEDVDVVGPILWHLLQQDGSPTACDGHGFLLVTNVLVDNVGVFCHRFTRIKKDKDTDSLRTSSDI